MSANVVDVPVSSRNQGSLQGSMSVTTDENALASMEQGDASSSGLVARKEPTSDGPQSILSTSNKRVGQIRPAATASPSQPPKATFVKHNRYDRVPGSRRRDWFKLKANDSTARE